MPSNYFNNPFLTIRQESKLASAAGNIRTVKELKYQIKILYYVLISWIILWLKTLSLQCVYGVPSGWLYFVCVS